MTADAAGRESATIVVIDDDDAVRHSIGQMMRLRGWAVEVFSSAEAALAWPGLRDAMCIVTDVKMPGMDGEELLARVTAMPGAPPVVMLTATPIRQRRASLGSCFSDRRAVSKQWH